MNLPIGAAPTPAVLGGTQWRQLAAAHERYVDRLTEGHRGRTARHLPHPVEDFLFTYYSLRPSQLRRWFPGAGTLLQDPGERVGWRFHRAGTVGRDTGAIVDIDEFRAVRADRITLIRRLLANTAGTNAQFGCFGLHEWAMVYRSGPDHRHPQLPLRLGAQGSDEVVRAHQLRCTHHDAFRFFTPEARPRNRSVPAATLAERAEQPGCLHATMDLYKWAYQLTPLTPSSLLVDCFLLAREIRVVDMRASPYDLSSLGYPPITIETAEGKAEYVAAQRLFAERGQRLRRRLLAAMDAAGV